MHDRRITGWAIGSAALVLAAGALAAGCGNRHPERTPAGALARLRDSLVNGQPPLAQVADTHVVYEAGMLSQANAIQEHTGMPLSNDGLAMLLGSLTNQMDPHTAFAGVVPMLRSGHCEKLADAELPDTIRHVPEPGEHWGTRARELQVSVARRLTNATASDWRCDGGPSFRAVFVHADPDDGSLRVAQIGPSGVR